MIFFGHVGTTTLILKAYDKVTQKENRQVIDYRFVAIGSILPDLIDKPIGGFFFRNEFHNSRLFGHTLLFSGILLVIGLFLMIKNKNRSNKIFLLGICSLIHQGLDSMWLYPGILYWPLYGWKFPTRPEGNWVESSLGKLLTDPYVYIPEVIGAAIIAYYASRVIAKGTIKEFFKYGRL